MENLKVASCLVYHNAPEYIKKFERVLKKVFFCWPVLSFCLCFCEIYVCARAPVWLADFGHLLISETEVSFSFCTSFAGDGLEPWVECDVYWRDLTALDDIRLSAQS